MTINLNALNAAKPKAYQPKILTFDIETSPHLVYDFNMYGKSFYHNPDAVVEYGRVLCFAAKWHHEKKVMFYGEDTMTHEEMIHHAWRLLDEADIVVGYNQNKFDLPHLHREFKLAGITGKYSPVRSVDLLTSMRSQFRFASNKLGNVGESLGIGNKIKHEGILLWIACLNGDEAAWKRMKRYNIQDVKLTEKLLDELGPWVKGFPNLSIYSDVLCCIRCASRNVYREGDYRTNVAIYERYQCTDCATWMYRTKNGKGLRAIA